MNKPINQKRNKILFIGTYLSKSRGTSSPIETISTKLTNIGYSCKLTSNKTKPVYRFFDTLFVILFGSYKNVFIDIYSSRTIYLTYLYVILLRLKRIKYFCILHGGGLPERYDSIKITLNSILKNSIKIITPSLYLKEFFEAKDFKIIYIANPIDINKFNFNYKKIDPSFSLKILWVRAFSNIYNPQLAINTLNEILRVFPESSLTMIGPDKGELNACLELINKLKINNKVKINGPIDNNNLKTYYQQHDILLNTTKYESFGLAIMESASCGTPVVSTNVGEIKYLWSNNNNIITSDEHSPKKLADCIINLVSNENTYKNIAFKGYENAIKFDIEIVIKDWINILSSK
ncbi:MAG: glycosyltransferase family 4 protein [Bacteroidia bacterium]|nr:glycosyltransferase family 4 protein [Bacteroidia bacterium]